MKNIFAILAFSALLGIDLQAQSHCNKNPLMLTFGAGVSKQDRRLFDFPLKQYTLDRENSIADFEYRITIQKDILRIGRSNLLVGIGYSEYNSWFSRPFKQSTFGDLSKVLLSLKRYTINQLTTPLSFVFLLNKPQRIQLNIASSPCFTFRKKVHLSGKNNYTKWLFEFTNLEICPGISKNVGKRLTIGVNYRAYYLNRLDPVIFYETLFNGAHPDFLDQKFEHINPFKLWVTASYRLDRCYPASPK